MSIDDYDSGGWCVVVVVTAGYQIHGSLVRPGLHPYISYYSVSEISLFGSFVVPNLDIM